MPSINFKGKNAIWNHHLSVPYQTLEKDEKLSVKGKNSEENLLIEADNLVALKSLLPKYQGKIKCIYIDPPYNTGSESWVYNDNVNSPLISDWIGITVGADDLTRHDKWLCMMTPRLKLMRDLLSEDGVIFISIDDNEVHHLRNILDEIFSNENFVGEFIWQKKKGGGNDSNYVATEHEYIVAYAKDKNFQNNWFGDYGDDYLKRYKEEDPDGRFFWDTMARPGLRNPIRYTIVAPDGSKITNDWVMSEKTYHKNLNLGKVRITKLSSGKWSVQFKQYLGEGKKPRSILDSAVVGVNADAKAELVEIFGKEGIFDNPKPSKLIRYLIDIVSDKDSIILDAFSGSATSAHAVLDLNNNDDGNRRFILIQLPEKISKDNPAFKLGFKYVADIARERIKRVIKKDNYDAGFSYMKLGPQIDAEAILSGKLPEYKEFAKYVYYLATGKVMENEKSINEKDYYAGKDSGRSIYLMYEKSKDKLKGLAITLEWAEKVNKKDQGKKLVYAPACFLDEEYLDKFGIDFVSIPYNLFEKK